MMHYQPYPSQPPSSSSKPYNWEHQEHILTYTRTQKDAYSRLGVHSHGNAFKFLIYTCAHMHRCWVSLPSFFCSVYPLPFFPLLTMIDNRFPSLTVELSFFHITGWGQVCFKMQTLNRRSKSKVLFLQTFWSWSMYPIMVPLRRNPCSLYLHSGFLLMVYISIFPLLVSFHILNYLSTHIYCDSLMFLTRKSASFSCDHVTVCIVLCLACFSLNSTPSFFPLTRPLETCDSLLCTTFVVVVLPSDFEGAVPICFLVVSHWVIHDTPLFFQTTLKLYTAFHQSLPKCPQDEQVRHSAVCMRFH